MTRTLLQITNLTKKFGERVLFEGVTTQVLEGKKIALVGPNGCGKTTLLKIIENREEYEEGSIEYMAWTRLSILKQNDPFIDNETVAEFFARTATHESWKYGKLLQQFGFAHDDQKRRVDSFSGGWQMRLRLVALLLQEPNILLLDEPTNYLDINTLMYLEQFIKQFAGTSITVSHDQEFLEKTCNQVMVFEGVRTQENTHQMVYTLKEYPGSIQEYLATRLMLEESAKEKNKQISRKQSQLQTFVDKFGAKNNLASAAQSKIKQIQRLEQEKIALGVARKKVRMVLPRVEKVHGFLMQAHNLLIGYKEKKVALVKELGIIFGEKIAVVGENGQGKSTLLKTLSGEITKLSGELSWKSGSIVLSYGQQVYKVFKGSETIAEFLYQRVGGMPLGEIMRVMGSFLFTRSDLDKQVCTLSGGEKSRVYLASMFLQKADVYLLDEPTNHLDFETINILAQAIKNFNGTVVTVSHNRSFLRIFTTKVWEVRDSHILVYNHGYDSYLAELEKQVELVNKEELFEDESFYLPKSIKSSGRIRYELQKEQQKLYKRLAKTDLDHDQRSTIELRLLEIEEELEE